MANPSDDPPSQSQSHRITLSVGDLARFLCRSGDLPLEGSLGRSNSRALSGIRAHQIIQEQRPESFEKEVTLEHNIETEAFSLKIRGRLDLVQSTPEFLLIEEIKTHTHPTPSPQAWHWAQGKIYAHLFGLTLEPHAQKTPIQIRLTFVRLPSFQIHTFEQTFLQKEIEDFFESLLQKYLEWMTIEIQWRTKRNAATQSLNFPFQNYRPGQRQLAVATWAAILRKHHLLAEAPTGLGKTISVLFPSIKSLGLGHCERILFLTAKTMGRTVAEKAIHLLKSQGLLLRSLTLTAKTTLCIEKESSPPKICNPKKCPLTQGYYDRLLPALREALDQGDLTRENLEALAQAHRLCPYQFTLDLTPWVDLIIADYNHVFHPNATLADFLNQASATSVLLIDEAHNLPDRAQEMYSASLDQTTLKILKSFAVNHFKDWLPPITQLHAWVGREWTQLRKKSDEDTLSFATEEPPAEKHQKALGQLLSLIEASFLQSYQLLEDWPGEILESYFELSSFFRGMEQFDSTYARIHERRQKNFTVKLHCLDPSPRLRKIHEKSRSSIFFSATLSPTPYYQHLLGLRISDKRICLPTPFHPEQWEIQIETRIRTQYQHREQTKEALAHLLWNWIKEKPGNYLLFFPSYTYMKLILENFPETNESRKILVQTAGMPLEERLQYLSHFEAPQKEFNSWLLGFAIMGGVFGEGIDLIGDHLIGLSIVGIGLPQISLEKDLIRNYFQALNRQGYEYAYAFPGWNRVVQAAGRLIRTETDSGRILLIDPRLTNPLYQKLWPLWWHPKLNR